MTDFSVTVENAQIRAALHRLRQKAVKLLRGEIHGAWGERNSIVKIYLCWGNLGAGEIGAVCLGLNPVMLALRGALGWRF